MIALVMVAPLPKGSNVAWAWSTLALAVGVLLMAWAALTALAPNLPVVAPGRVRIAIALFAVVPVWAMVQIMPWTPLNWHRPIWLNAKAIIGVEAPGRVSIDPHATQAATMRLLSYAGVFWLALQFGQSATHARRALKAVAIAGLGYAAYGLIAFQFYPEQMGLYERTELVGTLASTFVNRNSYATYAGIGLICAVALTLTSVFPPGEGQWRRTISISRLVVRAWWRILACICLVVALVLTQSRGGFVSTIVGLAVLLILFGMVRVVPWRHLGLSFVLICGIGMSVALVDSGGTLDRLTRTLEDAEVRLGIYDLAWSALGDAPLLGHGYGTFAEVYRLQDAGTERVYFTRAHNTYLGNFVELGIPVALALLAALGIIVALCARSLLRPEPAGRIYAVTGLAVTALVAAHSLVDFSIEMPAICRHLRHDPRGRLRSIPRAGAEADCCHLASRRQHLRGRCARRSPVPATRAVRSDVSS